VIGTGSYLPELWSETYATADIIASDGVLMVKAGREFEKTNSASAFGSIQRHPGSRQPRPRVVITTRSTTRCPGAQLTIPLMAS
jgi:hypothetical protein